MAKDTVMMQITVALLFLAASAAAAPAARANWISIARSADGSLLQLEANTYQRKGPQHATWIRLIKAAAKADGVKTSTFFVWLDCRKRSYNLMALAEENSAGKRVSQRLYGNKGRGFESVKPGTAMANAMSVICT